MKKLLIAQLLATTAVLYALPAQAAPVAIAVGFAAATGAAGVAIGVTTFAAAALSVAATAVVATASYFLTPRAAAASFTTAGLNSGASTGSAATFAPISSPGGASLNAARSLTVRQPLPPRRFVYGACRVSGAVFFQDVANPDLYIGVAISDGPIQAVDALYLGEDQIPVDGSGDATAGTRFFNLLSVEYGLGTATQAVSALLASAFSLVATSDFRQSGVARAVLSMSWGANAENHNFVYGAGIEPVFDVRGVLVGDPRDVALTKGDPSNYVYSNNPALCVLHAAVNSWHSELDYSDFNLASVEAAADDCDATIETPQGTKKIFTLAGVFQADAPIATQLADMLGSFGGVLTFVDGKYEIHADKDRASVHTFSDDDILGLEQYQFAAAPEDIFDAIKAVYFDTSNNSRRNTTPVIEIAGAAAPRETSIELPFTPETHSAQIIAYRALQEGRNGGEIVLRMSDAALYLNPAEVFTINSDALSIINGEYKCVQVDLAPIGCIVVAKKKVADAYATPSTYLQ